MRPTSTSALMAALITGLLLFCGCSHMSSRPPPHRPLSSMDECSDSTWPVVGDVYLALNTGSFTVLMLGAAALKHSENQSEVAPSWQPAERTGGVIPWLVAGAVFGYATYGVIKSASYGLDSAHACEEARLDYLRRQAPPPPMAPGLAPRSPGVSPFPTRPYAPPQPIPK